VTYTQQTWADGEGGGTPITAATLAHMEAGIGAAQVAAALDADVAVLAANPASAAGAAIKTVADSAAQDAITGLTIPIDADDIDDTATHVMMLASERGDLSATKATVDGATSVNTNSALVRRSASGTFSASGITISGTPTASTDAATKGYVDTALASVTVSTEQVQDIVGGMITAGTGISVTYDDAAGEVNIDVTSGGAVTAANLPAGSVMFVRKSGTWPSRPTSRSDITVFWIGADPDPSIVSSGTGGMLNNVDMRIPTA
jgi:hypothetical protein